MRILAYSLYEQPMAKGKVVFSKGRPFEWEHVMPSTVNGLFLNLGCSQIEMMLIMLSRVYLRRGFSLDDMCSMSIQFKLVLN